MYLKGVKYISIEGNIGAGKTLLSEKIACDIAGSEILLEDIDNFFLPKFYKNPSKYSLILEFSLLYQRYLQIKSIKNNKNQNFYISDFSFFKSLVFSRVTLKEPEFNVFFNYYHKLENELPKPGLIIYLDLPNKRLLDQIKTRGRKFEQSINDQYLEKIHMEFLNFIHNNQHNSHLIINADDSDFISNAENYKIILNAIPEFYSKKGINKLELRR